MRHNAAFCVCVSTFTAAFGSSWTCSWTARRSIGVHDVLELQNAIVTRNVMHAGVYVSINETVITNDGYVDSYDLIQNRLPLICHTNNMDCCRDDQLGDWLYPNGTTLKSFTVNTNKRIPEFFSRRRSQSRVIMIASGTYELRTFLGPPERGRFHCEVPDANDVNQTVYVNICELIAAYL